MGPCVVDGGHHFYNYSNPLSLGAALVCECYLGVGKS